MAKIPLISKPSTYVPVTVAPILDKSAGSESFVIDVMNKTNATLVPPVQQNEEADYTLYWVIGGIILLLAIYYFLIKK